MKITRELLNGAHNDSSKSVEEIVRRLGEGGVDISYGDLEMRVEAHQLERARAYVGEMDADERRRMMLSTTSALARRVPRVLKGSASKKINNEVYIDLMLWQVLKEAAAS